MFCRGNCSLKVSSLIKFFILLAGPSCYHAGSMWQLCAARATGESFV